MYAIVNDWVCGYLIIYHLTVKYRLNFALNRLRVVIAHKFCDI